MKRTCCWVLALLVSLSLAGLGGAAEIKLKPDVMKKIEESMPKTAPAKPKKPRKVLIFSKTMGFRHGSIPVGVVSLTMLGEKTGAYSSVHSEDESMFEPEKLKEFDAVLMLNTTGDIFKEKAPAEFTPKKGEKLSDELAAKKKEWEKTAKEKEDRLKKSLVEFVESGKGLMGTHSATDTYHGWKDYNVMMGGCFAGHPWHQKVPIKVLAPANPINAPFAGMGFEINDEIYQFRGDTANPSDRCMLLALDTEKMDVSKGNRKDKFYPVSWAATHGKGRTFYCSLGHNDHIYYNPLILQHYLAGFQFALGDLEADVAPLPVK